MRQLFVVLACVWHCQSSMSKASVDAYNSLNQSYFCPISRNRNLSYVINLNVKSCWYHNNATQTKYLSTMSYRETTLRFRRVSILSCNKWIVYCRILREGRHFNTICDNDYSSILSWKEPFKICVVWSGKETISLRLVALTIALPNSQTLHSNDLYVPHCVDMSIFQVYLSAFMKRIHDLALQVHNLIQQTGKQIIITWQSSMEQSQNHNSYTHKITNIKSIFPLVSCH